MILPYKPAYLFSIKYFCKQILVLWEDKDIKREAQCLLITREIKSVSWIYPFLWLIRNKRRPIKKYIIRSVVPGDFSKRSWRLYTIVPGNLRFLISTSLIGTSPMLLGGTSFLIKMPLQHQRFANQKSEGFHLSGVCKVTLIRSEITLIQINLHFDYKTICLMKSANNPLYLKY